MPAIGTIIELRCRCGEDIRDGNHAPSRAEPNRYKHREIFSVQIRDGTLNSLSLSPQLPRLLPLARGLTGLSRASQQQQLPAANHGKPSAQPLSFGFNGNGPHSFTEPEDTHRVSLRQGVED
nr:hypothetical protein CFP56_54544 [Quercus suber]